MASNPILLSPTGKLDCKTTTTSSDREEKQGSCTCTTTITRSETICIDEGYRKVSGLSQLWQSRIWSPAGCGPVTKNPPGTYRTYTVSSTTATDYTTHNPTTQWVGVANSIIRQANGDIGGFAETSGDLPSCF